MAAALYGDEFVSHQASTRDEPRLARPVYSQVFALSERIEHQPDVFADGFSFGRDHLAVVGRQVLLQEFAEQALVDEADINAVFLGGGRQFELGGKAADLGFFQTVQRENRALKLEGLEVVEEVASIFVLVKAFE